MPLRHSLYILGIVLAFVILIGLQRWKVLSAYLSCIFMFRTHADGETLHWPVFAWFSYSFAYWAIEHWPEDNVLLLTITSLAQAGAILLSNSLPKALETYKEGVSFLAAMILMIPFRCNNMHYSPVLSFGRLGVYFLLYYLDSDRHWIARQYPLFATQEVVVFLFAWHAFIWAKEQKTSRDPLPLPLTNDEKLCAVIAATLNDQSGE